MTTPSRTIEILEVLARYRVEYIVVGMTAGVLHGAPAVTFDLDIVYARTKENIERMLAALNELQAVFRTDDRRLAPKASHLASSGHKLLSTRFGQLDVLGELGEDEGYEALLSDTIILRVETMEVRVLGLERLIAVKERAGRDKDRAVLPLLRSTLARVRRK